MRIQFKTAQTMLLVSVLGLGVGVVGTAAYVNARYTAVHFGDQVMGASSNGITEHVNAALATAESESMVARKLLEEGSFDPDDHSSVTTYFLHAMLANQSLSYLSCGLESGKYYHVHRDPHGALSILWLLPQTDGSRYLLEWAVSATGDSTWPITAIPDSQRAPPYDRPYYQKAKKAGRPIWTETYVFLGKGEELDITGVSRAIPLYKNKTQFIGVLTADFDVLALSTYLRSLSVGENGFAFLLELREKGSPKLIAHPAAVDPDASKRLVLTKSVKDGGGDEALDAKEVKDSSVAQMAALIHKLPATGSAEMHEVAFSSDGIPYVGGYRALGGRDRPPWLLCMLIPEAEIFGGAQKTAQASLIIAVVGVLIALVMALLLSKRFSTPLQSIVEDTSAIADFRLDARAAVTSPITELAQLGTAMEEMKTSLRSFGKYVPTELVRSLVQSGQEAQLGGDNREVTLFFSDIAGFTSVAEELKAEKLVKLLGTYLGVMTAEMLSAGGTIDKYMGDGIMAFWGAPQSNPNHASDACRAALTNQRRLAELRTRWCQEGLPPIHARIGVHTGVVLIGNFGCESRLDYTAIGDSVNLAARLESINKAYGTDIIISESTYGQIGDDFAVRPLDVVAVKGKREGVKIYQLLGIKGEVDDTMVRCADSYRQALDHYLDRHWQKAVNGFGAVLKVDPGDKAARVLLARSQNYAETPPPESWNGVFRATVK